VDLPGSDQMGLGRMFFESLDWRRLVPRPGLCDYVDGAVDGLRPQAAAIPGGPTLVYAQRPLPLRVPAGFGSARFFDPVGGGYTRPSADGGCVAPPRGWDHDWVLLLDRN
jgi:hypothetical protein